MFNLRLLRKEKNLTMKELGDILNVGESTVSMWETGRREPDYQTLKKLTNYFNVSTDYLLGITTIKTPYKEKPLSAIENIAKKFDNFGKTTVNNIGNNFVNNIGKDKFADIGKYLEKFNPNSKISEIIGLSIHDINFLKELGEIFDKYGKNNKFSEPSYEPISSAADAAAADGYDDEANQNDYDVVYVDMKVYDMPASAGLGNYFNEESSYETIQCSESDVPSKADFGIRISGDSMSPLIKNNSIVWIKEQLEINSGEIGIFILNNESFCNKLKIEVINNTRTVSLVSVNPRNKPITITKRDNLRTVGKVLI